MEKEQAIRMLNEDLAVDYGGMSQEEVEEMDKAIDYAIECVQKRPSKDDALRFGLLLNRLAMMQSPESYERTKGTLTELEKMIEGVCL